MHVFCSDYLGNVILALAWGLSFLEVIASWHKQYHQHISDSRLSKNHLRVFFLNFQFSLMWADLNFTNKTTRKRDEFYVLLIYVSIRKLMKFPKTLEMMKLKTWPYFCCSAKIQNKLHCSKSWVMFSISSFLTILNISSWYRGIRLE